MASSQSPFPLLASIHANGIGGCRWDYLWIIEFSSSSPQPCSFKLSPFLTRNGPNLWVLLIIFILFFLLHDNFSLLGLPEILSFWTYLHRYPVSGRFRSASCSHLDSFHFFKKFSLFTAVHVIRIHAIYDKNRLILFAMSALLAVQVVVTAVCCAFYRCMSGFYCTFMALLISFI